MKKKTIALCGLAAIAGLSLTSCGPKAEEGLDIYINYSGTSGITYRGSTPFQNTIDGKSYTNGVMLPTWTAFSENIGTTFYDASGYTTSSDNDTYSLVQSKGYVSDTNAKRKIDLFYNTTANINAMGGAGEAIDLVPHLDEMPNFKKFLDANPTIRATLEKSGKIYYTPYFDGYNDIERMFVMDTQIAEKVLDAESFAGFDTVISGKGAPANTVQAPEYSGYMGESNLPDSEFTNGKATITVLGSDNKATTIQINKVENIITRQNALLNADGGVTGKALAEDFRAYLTAVYGDNVGADKIYKNYSDIFTSAAAAYTTDEDRKSVV